MLDIYQFITHCTFSNFHWQTIHRCILLTSFLTIQFYLHKLLISKLQLLSGHIWCSLLPFKKCFSVKVMKCISYRLHCHQIFRAYTISGMPSNLCLLDSQIVYLLLQYLRMNFIRKVSSYLCILLSNSMLLSTWIHAALNWHCQLQELYAYHCLPSLRQEFYYAPI